MSQPLGQDDPFLYVRRQQAHVEQVQQVPQTPSVEHQPAELCFLHAPHLPHRVVQLLQYVPEAIFVKQQTHFVHVQQSPHL